MQLWTKASFINYEKYVKWGGGSIYEIILKITVNSEEQIYFYCNK